MTLCPYCNKPLVPARTWPSGGYLHEATRKSECRLDDLKAVIDATKELQRWKTVSEKMPTPNVVYELVHIIHGNRGRTLGAWIPTVPPSSEDETPSTRYPDGWDTEGVTHYREYDDSWPE